MEAICRGRGSGSLGRDRSFGIGYELVTICYKLASDWPRFLPRSGHDRVSIVVLVSSRSSSNPMEAIHDEISMIAARSRRDRGSIGPQLWSSSMNSLSRPIALQVTRWSRSRNHVDPDCEERPPCDGGRSRG